MSKFGYYSECDNQLTNVLTNAMNDYSPLSVFTPPPPSGSRVDCGVVFPLLSAGRLLSTEVCGYHTQGEITGPSCTLKRVYSSAGGGMRPCTAVQGRGPGLGPCTVCGSDFMKVLTYRTVIEGSGPSAGGYLGRRVSGREGLCDECPGGPDGGY